MFEANYLDFCQREVRSSLGPTGEDFSGSGAVTSRNSLLRDGATKATQLSRFGAEGVATCRPGVLAAALDGSKGGLGRSSPDPLFVYFTP